MKIFLYIELHLIYMGSVYTVMYAADHSAEKINTVRRCKCNHQGRGRGVVVVAEIEEIVVVIAVAVLHLPKQMMTQTTSLQELQD